MLAPARSPRKTIASIPLGLILGCLTLLIFAPWAVRPASAQVTTTTINQTSCVQGDSGGTCLTGGFLKDLSVNCGASGQARLISTALSQIEDRNGPNRITISGTCNEVPIITGFNRLRIEGSGGAIMRGTQFRNSRDIVLKSLTITSIGGGNGLFLTSSSVVLDGVTVQVGGNGINLSFQSFLGFTGALSNISGNGLAGILAAGGSAVNLANVTVSNNGSQGGGGTVTSSGVVVTGGSSVLLFSKLGNADAPVDISGNVKGGILVDTGTLGMGLTSPTAPIHIHGNGGAGLGVENGHAVISGQAVKFDGNSSCCSAALQLAVFGGILELGGGVQVQGGVGGFLNANIVIGDSEGTGGAMTIDGALTLVAGSVAALANSNTIGSLACDATSWAQTDGQSTIGPNSCLSSPTVTVNTGTGLSGGGALPLGGSITLNNTGVLSVSADPVSPLTSTGGQNAVVGITPNYYIQNGTSPQSNASFNVTGSGSIGGAVTIGNGTPITQYVSSTFTVAMPSLKPNTCTNVTQSWTAVGSGTTDTIALGVPNAFMSAGGFLMFQAWESAPNAITIRGCNVSPNGPASGAVSGTIRVSLFKH
jgi:hypothetical protein